MQKVLQDYGALSESLQARLDYWQRLQLLVAVSFLSSWYLHTLVRRLAPSTASLVAIMPLMVLNACIPALFNVHTELLTRVVVALLTAWLGNFKAVGLCLQRGPLANPSWNLLQFSLLYLMPIYPRQDGPVKKGRLTDSAGGTSKMVWLAAANAVAVSVLAYMLAVVPMPLMLKHYIYAHALCSFVSFVMNGPAALLIALAELEVVPPFDRPWAATSLADFWGRRWNNTVSLTLRSLCYDTVAEGCLVHTPPPAAAAAAPAGAAAAKPANGTPSNSSGSGSGKTAAGSKHPRVSLLRRLGGTAATFAASGLMHEVMLLYALQPGDPYPAGYWFMFFFIQFPLLVVEDAVSKAMRARGTPVPQLVLRLWFNAMMLLTAYFFWFPPIEIYTPLAPRIVEAVNANADAVVRGVRGFAQQLGLPDVAQAAAAAVSGPVSHAAVA